jgi:hypothetical protein
MKIRIAMLVLVTGLTVSAFAADARTPSATNASSAFEQLKALVGTWQADTDMGKLQATYELVSNGHVLLERVNDGSMHHNMITTYYVDGDALALTHYCELGNEPHMVARKINLDGREIIFDFAGSGNLASLNAQHMHAATIRLVDADHFTGAWTMFENAKPKFTVTAQYARVK